MEFLIGYLFEAAIFMIILLGLAVVAYVLYGLSHSRALKHMGYDKPWMAWIPFGNMMALAECTRQPEFKLGTLVVPMNVFRFWWAAALVINFVPFIGTLAFWVMMIICQGWCYGMIYAVTERRPVDEMRVLGYFSGVITIIPIVKFFQLPKEVEE